MTGGMSSGAIVGVCFAVLIIFCATLLGGFFVYKKQTGPKSPDIVEFQTTGFDNVLYSSNQGVNIEKTEGATPGSDA